MTVSFGAYPVREQRLDLPLLEVRLVGEPRDGVAAEGEARRPLRVVHLHPLHPALVLASPSASTL